jgi:hypothetical protein
MLVQSVTNDAHKMLLLHLADAWRRLAERIEPQSALPKTVQAIATELADYSKRSYENNTKAVEKLFGVKSLDKAIEVQSECAKTIYEDYSAQVTKLTFASILPKKSSSRSRAKLRRRRPPCNSRDDMEMHSERNGHRA